MAKENCKHDLFCSLLSVDSVNTKSLLLTEKNTGIHYWYNSALTTGIRFDNSVLVVEQNNYACEIVNVYIFYHLDIFTLKNFLFGATNIVKNNIKENCVYSGYGIAFDGASEWSFNKDSARNVIIFGVDNNHHLMLTITRITF